MVSVASDGTADRIATRILFRVLRAGCGTPARYSSTFFATLLPFAADLRLPDCSLFMPTMLQELPLPDHPPDHQAPQKDRISHSCKTHTRPQRKRKCGSGCGTESLRAAAARPKRQRC